MRLLLVVSRPPWPPRKGDQLRAVQVLEALTRHHRVTLLTPRWPAAGDDVPPPSLTGALDTGRLTVATYRPAGPWGRLRGLARAAVTGRPLQNGLFRSPDLLRSFRRLASSMDGVVIQLVRLADLLDEAEVLGERGDGDGPGGPPVVVDLIDSLELNISRRAALDRPLWRPFLRLEQRRLARAEARVLAGARRTVVVSPRDEAWLRRRHGGDHGRDIEDRLVTVPLAMEAAGGLPAPTARAADGDESSPVTIALTGNLGYFPNVHGACWWLERVWPHLAAQSPRLRLVLAGARPARRLVRLAAAAPRVELLAWPSNLKAVLAGADLAVAPLFAGSGVPVKVLEAWATGVPVVASPWAAAGTGAVPGEDLLLAGDPGEWMETVMSLADDPALRWRLARAGRRRLETDHSPRIVRETWSSLVEWAFSPAERPEP